MFQFDYNLTYPITFSFIFTSLHKYVTTYLKLQLLKKKTAFTIKTPAEKETAYTYKT